MLKNAVVIIADVTGSKKMATNERYEGQYCIIRPKGSHKLYSDIHPKQISLLNVKILHVKNHKLIEKTIKSF